MYIQTEDGWAKDGVFLNDFLKNEGISLSEIEANLIPPNKFLVKTKFSSILKIEVSKKGVKVTPYHLDDNRDLRFIWDPESITPLSKEASKYVDYETNFLNIKKLERDGLDYYVEFIGKHTILGLIKEVITNEFKSLIDFKKDVKQIEELKKDSPFGTPNYITVIKVYDEISRERLKDNLNNAKEYMKDIYIYYTGINEFSILSTYSITDVITENMIVAFKSMAISKFDSRDVVEIRKRMFKELKLDQNKEEDNIIKGYFRALFHKTDETVEHSERLQRIVTLIGEELAITDEEMTLLWKMAKIHDIGKLAIEGKIINKPGKLSSDEFAIIKRHTVLGYEMMKGIKSYNDARLVCIQHHERWDGTGYPNNLKGNDINFLSRILTVADSIDAMLSARVYKPSFTMEYVRNELDSCQGTHFCPQTSKAALNIFDKIEELYK